MRKKSGYLLTTFLFMFGCGIVPSIVPVDTSVAEVPTNLLLGPVGTTINFFLSDPSNSGKAMAQGSGMFWNLKGASGAFKAEDASGMVYFSWVAGTYSIDTVNTAADNASQSDRLAYTIVMGPTGPISVTGPNLDVTPNAQGIYVVTSALPPVVVPDDPNNPWHQLQGVPLIRAGHMLLLTDGSVLFHEEGSSQVGTSDWWKLQPDSHGNYLTGIWTQLASTPASYQPANLASGVLPDGRVILEGGDMNGTGTWVGQNTGEIYDPVANTWSAVSPPNNGQGEFSSIADAPSVVLPSGSFMFGPSGNGDAGAVNQQSIAIFNADTSSWNVVTGANRRSANPETAFTLLPNGSILCISTLYKNTDKTADLYNPVTQVWSQTGPLPISLLNGLTADGGSIAEIGPSIVMPNGKVLAEGSDSQTALYDSGTNTWSSGPAFPVINGINYVADDAPSAILPNGNVLMELSPVDKSGHAIAPTHLFTFDGSTFTQIASPNQSSLIVEPAFLGALLPLPNGQMMMTDRGMGTVYVYTPTGTSNQSYLPVITSADKLIAAGSTYSLSGNQLSGLTTGASYGDDWNPNTNYPLVQITNNTNGEVTYGRTFKISSYSIAPNAPGTLSYQLPSTITNGLSSLRVVASGFASSPVLVTITGGTPLPTPTATPTATPTPVVSPAPTATPTPIVFPTPTPLSTSVSTKAISKKTIVCIKGKVSKKVSGLNPKCPSGYKAKK
jgi:hypothetical protein